jgi:hypothetical protein
MYAPPCLRVVYRPALRAVPALIAIRLAVPARALRAVPTPALRAARMAADGTLVTLSLPVRALGLVIRSDVRARAGFGAAPSASAMARAGAVGTTSSDGGDETSLHSAFRLTAIFLAAQHGSDAVWWMICSEAPRSPGVALTTEVDLRNRPGSTQRLRRQSQELCRRGAANILERAHRIQR